MLPVADNLLQVGGRVKQEMLPPFVPVHGHSAIDIDTAQGKTEGIDILTTLTTFSPKKLETFIGSMQANITNSGRATNLIYPITGIMNLWSY